MGFSGFLANTNTALTPLESLQNKILEAYNGQRSLVYIVAGDSNRNGSTVTQMKEYYDLVFDQINIPVIYSAASGQTAENWRTNVNALASAHLSYAIANSKGTDGEDTILEFGYGINDYNAYSAGTITFEELKNQLLNAISEYLAAKPKATVLLVSPTRTVDPKTSDLITIYKEIAEELQLPYVSGFEATKNVYVADPVGAPATGNAYYQEPTHINDNGARRLVNYIIQNIFPASIHWHFSLPNYSVIGAEPALPNLAVIETGLWNDLGASLAGGGWRRLQSVAVYGYAIYRLKHTGNRREVIWLNGAGDATKVTLRNWLPGQIEWLIEAPADAVSLKINISSSGTAYDASGDVPILENVVPATSYNMPQDKLNIGNSIKIQ